MSGVSTWTDPAFLLPNRGLWLDGKMIATAVGEGTPPFRYQEGEGIAVQRAASGKHLLWRPYVGSGTDLPHLPRGLTFAVDVGALDEQADWRHVELARQRGQAVDFCIGIRVVDSFDVQTNDVVTLARRRADGIVTGVNETSYPTKFFLDGSEGSHGTVLGQQQVTAQGNGRLDVEYTPIHYVVLLPADRSLAAFNDLAEGIEAVEVVSFG